MGEFRMPSLGADMVSGILVEWYIGPGDRVVRGQVVAAIETDKGIIDIEIFEDAVIAELLVVPGARVPVGTPLARLEPAGSARQPRAAAPPPPTEPEVAPTPAAPTPPGPEVAHTPPAPPPPTEPEVAPTPAAPARAVLAPAAAPAPASPEPTAPAPRPPAEGPAPPPPPPEPPLAAGHDEPLRASPRARRLATDRGIDLSTVSGTGPEGAIRAVDLEAAPAPATAPRPAARRFDPEAMRAAIAAAMERSKREIPHYYLLHDVDLGAAEAWLEGYNAERPPTERVLVAALMLRAVARAARAHPKMNGSRRDGVYQPADRVHLAVAVSLRGGGLVTPAIHDTDQRPLPELMAALADVVKRARSGRLKGSELTDGTLTVTSLGVSGVEAVLPVIYPPQVACVGFGKITQRPRVVGAQVVARPVLTATLGADHRVSDGHDGALFLRAIDKALNNPEELL